MRQRFSSNTGLLVVGIGLAVVTALITTGASSPPDGPASPRDMQAVRDVAP